MFMPRLSRLIAVALLPALAGCSAFDGWFGSSAPPPLPGERVSVLALAETLEPDPQLAQLAVTLPQPVRNADWPQAGAGPAHSPGHLALGESFREVWSVSIGWGSGSDRVLINPPIMADGRVFAMDATGQVTAVDAATGREIWQVRVASPHEDSEPLGGGLAFADGLLFASTGFGEVLAVDPANGGQVWREEANGPLRAPPAVEGGRVFVVTVENQIEAFAAPTGEALWNHTGILETASLLGGAAPAVGGGVVIAPYSSGELFALRVESGRAVWSDSLTAIRRVGALASLADIRGMPVIDNDRVFAVSHSGRTVGIDLRTGQRVWEQAFGGINMPWVAGDFIFMLTNTNDVVALTRDGGRIRWVASLPRWRDPDRRRGNIVFAGPVLAGGRLILVGSEGEGVIVNATDGSMLGGFDLRGAAQIPPIVADGTLYVLTDNGYLTAYR